MKITENQILDLATDLSLKIEEIVDHGYTESEECGLAILIAQWIRENGDEVVESTQE